MRALLLTICCVAALCPPAFAADALRALPVLRRGVIADRVGIENIHIVDVDGDAKLDLVACAADAPFVLQYHDGDYRVYWQGAAVGCTGVAVGDRDGDGGLEVIVGTSTGQLYVFDPRSAGPAIATATVPGSAAVQDVLAAYVDGDAGLELVVVLAGATLVYDAATLAVEWTATGYGGTRARVGDIDGDPVREIVVNGTTGSVLDATTQTLEWGYAGGFGTSMAVGNVDGDARAEIVYAQQWSATVTILNGDTFVTSTIALEDYTDVIGLGDSNGDGINEILSGDNQWGSVSGYDAGTGTQQWSVPNPEHGGHFVAVADMDGDGSVEVLWGSGSSSSGEDALFIADPETDVIEWKSIDLDGPFHSDAADLDGNGRMEWLVSTHSSGSGYDAGTLEITDIPSRGTLSFFTNISPHTWGDITNIAGGQLDADPAQEVLVYGGGLRAIDGVSGAAEWTSGGTFVGRDVHVLNVDGDAVDEIIGAMSDSKIVVLNGATNVIQASRTYDGFIIDLAIADTDGTGAPELIVATSSKLTVLSLPALTLRTEIAITNLYRVAGSTVGGGTIAAVFGTSPRLRTFAASDLSARWSCSGFTGADTLSAITFADIGGAPRLLAANPAGLLRAFRFDGADCEIGETASLAPGIHNLAIRDVTQDGRLELLVDAQSSAEIVLLGLPSEARGEVTGDGLLTAADATRLTDYVFGAVNGLAPGGDVNADGRIAPEDVFALVHHLFDGGPAPQP